MQHSGGSRDGNGVGGVLNMALHLLDVDALVHVGQLLSKPFPDAHEPSLHHHCPACTHQPCLRVTVTNTATMSLCHSPKHSNHVLCHIMCYVPRVSWHACMAPVQSSWACCSTDCQMHWTLSCVIMQQASLIPRCANVLAALCLRLRQVVLMLDW